MSSSSALPTLDVEKLIADIAIRPAIWDRSFNSRQNKSFLEDTWDELAEIHNAPSKLLKAKWKCLRDNFRIQWKMIPRDENDDLLISPEEFTGTKWQYYKHLIFLAGNMGKARTNNSYNQNTLEEDQNYDLLQLYEESNELPSVSKEEFETIYDRKTSIALYQRQLQQHHLQQELNEQKAQKDLPKLEAISQPKIIDVKSLIDRKIPQSTFTPPSVANFKSNHHPQTSLKPPSFHQDHKRKRLDEVTTTNGGNSSHISSNEEYLSVSSPNLPNIPNDDDYHFIMSLKPYLHQFNGPQKLKVQMLIQKLVFKELYNHEIDQDD
ncbi:unnamed protein product [Diamesa hyperborea]